MTSKSVAFLDVVDRIAAIGYPLKTTTFYTESEHFDSLLDGTMVHVMVVRPEGLHVFYAPTPHVRFLFDAYGE